MQRRDDIDHGRKENERLKKNLEESKNWQKDLESKLHKSKGQVYTLEVEFRIIPS